MMTSRGRNTQLYWYYTKKVVFEGHLFISVFEFTQFSKVIDQPYVWNNGYVLGIKWQLQGDMKKLTHSIERWKWNVKNDGNLNVEMWILLFFDGLDIKIECLKTLLQGKYTIGNK